MSQPQPHPNVATLLALTPPDIRALGRNDVFIRIGWTNGMTQA